MSNGGLAFRCAYAIVAAMGQAANGNGVAFDYQAHASEWGKRHGLSNGACEELDQFVRVACREAVQRECAPLRDEVQRLRQVLQLTQNRLADVPCIVDNAIAEVFR